MPTYAAPPYNPPPYNSTIYNNPTFQNLDPGIHQPTSNDLDIDFGNDGFDTSALQYREMNTAKLDGLLSEEGKISPSESTRPPDEPATTEFLNNSSDKDDEPPTRCITHSAIQLPPAPSPAPRSKPATLPAPAAVFTPPTSPNPCQTATSRPSFIKRIGTSSNRAIHATAY